MSANNSDDDFSEKTFVTQSVTVKIKHNLLFKAPACLVIIAGPQDVIGRQYPLEKERMVLGRLPSCDISIGEVSISKQHALFEMKNNAVYLTDLGATNFTYVNEINLPPQTVRELKNDDQIRTGNLILKFLARGLISETSEKARMQSELKTARSVQENLLPPQAWAQYKGLHIAGRYQTATECGGDWWWHWSTKTKAFALIADATGHGAGAALITSAARAAVGVIEEDDTANIEKVYLTLTTAINKCANGQLLMSAFLVEADFETRKLRYINASHLPAVALPRKLANIKWNQLIFVSEPVSPTLGSENKEFIVGEGSIPSTGMRLMLLTDGLVERRMANGEPMKEREFNNMLIQTHNENLISPRQFLDTLFTKSDQRAGGVSQDDDITAVVLDFD